MNNNQEKYRLGFIGLGTMGKPMCKRLLEAGYEVIVYDKNPDPVSDLVNEGATAANDPIECGSASQILLTSLPHPHHVETLMLKEGVLASLKSESIWVDLTTNRKELIESLANDAPKDVSVVDSPVTGAVDGARNGQLTLFAGGQKEIIKEVLPVLQNLGQVIMCGPLGTGNVVKLVTNQLWFIAAASIGEGFALGMANGVDLSVLWEAIKDSVGDSFVARHDAPSIFAGHYDPSFSLDLCLKDLNLIQSLSSQVGTELPMTKTANSVFEKAADQYGRDAGEMNVTRMLEDQSGLSFRLEGEWIPPWES
ncbi:MAG: NAD(P)-dependent oxidoreductase [Acidimicrobiales bacterium]|jgi:3-hydroxyisobutyrate dehydrogenase-like beta-hydroxyacid dehydrogenase|nr:NAD(P)-dependent oxidoreductase [Acidimicrobiales bacterium]